MRYWEGKLFHDAYTCDGRRVVGTDWSVRIQHQGRRESFPLHTPNKAMAAAKAKQVFSVLSGGGWQEALQRFKPEAVVPVRDNATVGDLIGEVMAIGGLRPKTLADYVKAFRLIVADIFKIDGGRDKFDPHTGGRQKWLEKVEAIRLADVTPEKVQRWKLAFLKRAGDDPAAQRRAKTSVNSLLRQAKSLFSKKSRRFLTLKLPDPLPFDGVDFESRQTMRYHSTLDPQVLISAARKELAQGGEEKPEQYKVFLLILCAGLRRNEIDKLEWNAFDYGRHTVRIETTEFLHPKTEESTGEVEIDAEIAAIFKQFQRTASGSFAIESDRMPILNSTYATYRCKKVFGRLTDWLREKVSTRGNRSTNSEKNLVPPSPTNTGFLPRLVRCGTPTLVSLTRHYADSKRRVTAGFGHHFGASDVGVLTTPMAAKPAKRTNQSR